VAVLCWYCTSIIRSRSIFSPHEGWSSLCGRTGCKKDCFHPVPCLPFLLFQIEPSSLYPYRIFPLLNLTMEMESVYCSQTLVCICRSTWCHTDNSVLWLHYGLDDLGFESWQDQDIFISFSTSRPVVGPTTLLLEWCPGSFPGVMRTERECDASIESRC